MELKTTQVQSHMRESHETLPSASARQDHYTYTADDQIDTVKYNWNQTASTQDRLGKGGQCA